jgi:hypothetical protein
MRRNGRQEQEPAAEETAPTAEEVAQAPEYEQTSQGETAAATTEEAQ